MKIERGSVYRSEQLACAHGMRLKDLIEQAPVMNRLKAMADLAIDNREGGFRIMGHVLPDQERRITVSPFVEGEMARIQLSLGSDVDVDGALGEKGDEMTSFAILNIHAYPLFMEVRTSFSPTDFDNTIGLIDPDPAEYFPGLTTLGLLSVSAVGNNAFLGTLLWIQEPRGFDRCVLDQYAGVGGTEYPPQVYKNMGFRVHTNMFWHRKGEKIRLNNPLRLGHFRFWPTAKEAKTMEMDKARFDRWCDEHENRFPVTEEDETLERLTDQVLSGIVICLKEGGNQYAFHDPALADEDASAMCWIPLEMKLETSYQLISIKRMLSMIHIKGPLAKALTASVEAAVTAGELVPAFTVTLNRTSMYYWGESGSALSELLQDFKEKTNGLLFKDEVFATYGELPQGMVTADKVIQGPDGENFEFFKPETLTKLDVRMRGLSGMLDLLESIKR